MIESIKKLVLWFFPKKKKADEPKSQMFAKTQERQVKHTPARSKNKPNMKKKRGY